MKKKDMLLAGSVCVLAAVIWIAVHVFMPKENHKIRITVDGEVFGEYSLDENRKLRSETQMSAGFRMERYR